MITSRQSLLLSATGAALLLALAAPALAAPGPSLSPAQDQAVTRMIESLQAPEERRLAASWSDAKKVAEAICRPKARSMLQRRFKGADRVFLGTDDPATLRLVSQSRLEGSGQVRDAGGWRDFTFVCGLDPKTGRATHFKTTPAP